MAYAISRYPDGRSTTDVGGTGVAFTPDYGPAQWARAMGERYRGAGTAGAPTQQPERVGGASARGAPRQKYGTRAAVGAMQGGPGGGDGMVEVPVYQSYIYGQQGPQYSGFKRSPQDVMVKVMRMSPSAASGFFAQSGAVEQPGPSAASLQNRPQAQQSQEEAQPAADDWYSRSPAERTLILSREYDKREEERRRQEQQGRG